MPAPILLLALAGGVAAFALSKKKPSPTSPSGVPTSNAGAPGGGPAASTLSGAGAIPPAEVLKIIAAALASANPTAMRAAADEVEKVGFSAQAADLRAAALAIEKATAGAATVGPPFINTTGQTVGIPQIRPSTPVTPVQNPNTGKVINLPEEVITASANPKKDQAAAVTLMLGSTPRFKENRTQVTSFQQANLAEEKKSATILGKAGASADGLYGTTTALTLARVYGIVPPAPFYYPTNPTPAKKAYMAQMAKFAAADPQRADEWNHAGESVKNM